MQKIKVLLVDMPPYMADVGRLQEVSSLAQELKLPCGNGHDHFSYLGRSTKIDDETLPLFGWIGKTRFAE